MLRNFGPLALFGATLVIITYHNYPLTLDATRTYFAVSLAAVAGLVIVAGLAATIACGRLGPQRRA